MKLINYFIHHFKLNNYLKEYFSFDLIVQFTKNFTFNSGYFE